MAERTFQKKRTIQNKCNIQNRHTMQSKSMQTNNSANASADISADTSNPAEISHPNNSSDQNIDDTQAVHSKSSVLVHGMSSDDKSSAYDDKNSANYDESSVHTDGSDETDGTNEKTADSTVNEDAVVGIAKDTAADSAVEEDAVEGRVKDTAADAVENANEHAVENTAESVVEDVVEDADESVANVVENTADNAAGDAVDMAEKAAENTVEVAENRAENEDVDAANDATESSMSSATNSSCQVDVSLKVLEWVEGQIQNADVSNETRDEIQAWIKGTRQPVFSKIRQISRETGIPLGYFFLKKPPIEDISFMSWTSSQELSSWPPSRNLIEVYHDMRMVQDWMQSFLINELASPIEYFNTDFSECLQDYWKTSLNEYLNEYVNDFVNDYVGKLLADTGLDANKSTYQSCDYLTACNFNSGLDSNGLDSNTACLSNCLSNSCLDDSTARVSNCFSNIGLGDDTTNVSNSSNSSNSMDANTVGSLENIKLLSNEQLFNEQLSNKLISEGLLSTPHDPHDTAQSKNTCIHSCERIAEQLRKILDLPTDWNAAYEVSEGSFNQLRQAISNAGTLVMMSGSAGNAYDDKLLDISGNLPIYKQDVSRDIGKVLEHGIGNKQGSASSLTLNEEIDSVSKDTLCHILDGSLRHTLDTEDTEQSRKSCFVRDRSLDIKEFRAFCFADEYAPLIFINANASVEERLFALVYEFMHVCLGKNSVFNAQDVWLDYAQVRADGIFQWQKPENTAHSKSDGDLFSREMMGIRAAFDIGKSKLALYGLCFDNSNIESKNEVALGKAFYGEKFKNNKLYLDIDVEGLCREVTYEFLIPHRVILAEWNNCIQNCAPQQNCTPQDAVLKLARIFKTGVIALASRLCHSHLITPEVYQAIVQSNAPCLKEHSAVTSSASLTSSASSVKSSQDVGHTVEQSCEDRHTAELICDKEGNKELQNSQQQNCEAQKCESQNHQQQNCEVQNSQPHNREEVSGEQPNCEVLNSKAGNSDVQNCKQQNTETGNSEQQSSEPQIKESIHAALARKCCNAGHIEYVGYYAKQFMQGLVIDLKLECQPLFIKSKSKGILSHPTETDTNQTGVNSNQLATNSHIAPAVLNFGNNDQTANAPEDLVKGNSRGSSGLQSVSEPESKTRGAGADYHVQSNNHHTELTELTELTEAASNQTAINQDNQEARADSVSNPSTATSLSTATSGLESGGTSGSLSDSGSAVVSDSSSCLAPSVVSGASSDLASSSSVSAVSDVLDVSDLLDVPDVLDNELSLSDLATAATPVSDVASVESVVATPVSDAVSVDLVLDAETLAASSASGTTPVSNSPQESSVSSVSSASSVSTDNEKSEAAVLILADDDSNRARVLAESRINTDDTSRVNTDSASDESSLDEVRYDVSDALNDAMQTGDTLELSSTWDAYGASEKQDVVSNVGDMTLQKSKVEFSAECLAAANRLDKHFLNALISSVQEGKTLYTDAFRLTGVDRVVFSELIKFMCMEDE